MLPKCRRLKKFFRDLYEKIFIKKVRVLFVGLPNSGKSSIISPLFNPEYKKNERYSSIKIHTYNIDSFMFVIYDIPGGREFRSKWDHYFKKSDILFFFISSVATDEECDESKDELMGLIFRNLWMKKPMLVLGTKNDLPDAMECKDVILKLDLVTLGDREVGCYSISSKNIINIDLVKAWLLEKATEI